MSRRVIFYRTDLRAQKVCRSADASTCTGETVIGFRTKADGHLLNAVVVRSRADIETFYKSYGFVYTGKFDK